MQQPIANVFDANWDSNGSFESNQPVSGMFFLAGSWGDDPEAGTVRTIGAEPGDHVPVGTPVLIPILNSISSQSQSDPKSTNNVNAQDWKVNVSDLFLKTDGQDVKNLQSDLIRAGSVSAGSATPDSVGAYLADPANGMVETLKSPATGRSQPSRRANMSSSLAAPA